MSLYFQIIGRSLSVKLFSAGWAKSGFPSLRTSQFRISCAVTYLLLSLAITWFTVLLLIEVSFGIQEVKTLYCNNYGEQVLNLLALH